MFLVPAQDQSYLVYFVDIALRRRTERVELGLGVSIALYLTWEPVNPNPDHSFGPIP